MNMTYDEFKKLKKFFYENMHEGLCEMDEDCPSEALCELFEEWINVKNEYANIDFYIDELLEKGFDY